MPSFVLSLALLLLVLLTLLAVSNRELIALTFLGFSTVALPLSIWILGAIALGFLLGLWILLLFRLGATGLGSGSGAPAWGRQRANYGPEDFAVVDERFAEGGDRDDDGRYRDNRYDDVYGQGQYQPDVTASQSSNRGYATDRYPADSPSNRYGNDGYGESDGYGTDRYGRGESDYYGTEQQSYGDPQDRFSAASGYESSANGAVSSDAQNRNQPPEPPQTTLQSSSSTMDPTVPADWDDQYREDWTQEELVAEPILRNEGTAPKLKRWLSQPGEGRPKLNLGGFGLGGATESGKGEPSLGQSADSGRSPAEPGEVTDWQGARSGDRNDDGSSAYGNESQGRGEVYDADYRVVRQPEGRAESSPRSEPSPQREAPTDKAAQESKRDSSESSPSNRPKKSEWDIESDLDW